MKRIIVAIEIEWIDNFNHLPPIFTLGTGKNKVEVMVHYNPKAEFQGTEYSCNFDILITTNESCRVWPEHITVVHLPRYTKLEQAMMLAEFNKALEFDNFLPIKTYSRIEGSALGISRGDQKVKKGWAFGGNMDIDKYHVIKSMDGAKGLGQFVFKPSEVSVNCLLVALFDKNVTVDYLQQNFPSLIIPEERETDDLIQGIRDLAVQGVVLQEVVGNVIDEYRLLISNSNIKHIGNRTRMGDKYKQATGVTTELLYKGNLSNDRLAGRIMPEVNKMIEQLDIKFGSADLFITSDGKWGFFEWCNQFGTAAFNPAAQKQFHCEFIEHWVNIHLAK